MGACCSNDTVQLPPSTIALRSVPVPAPPKAAKKIHSSEYKVDMSSSGEHQPAPEPATNDEDSDDVVASPTRAKKGRVASVTSRQLRSSTVRRMYGNLKKYAQSVDEVFHRDTSPDRFITFNSYEYDELAPLQHEWWIDPTAITDTRAIPSVTMVCEYAFLDGQEVFIKRLDRNASSHKLSRSRRLLMAEVHIGAKVEHPFIATFLGFCITPYSGLSCVSEFVHGSSLLEMLSSGPLSWHEHKLPWARQIAAALVYLHSMQITHRNLKPDTILITAKTGAVKLLGMGHGATSSFVNHHPPTTSEWSAPELLQGRDVSEKTDVYSFGLVLLSLELQASPFAAASAHYHELMMKILTGTLKPVVPATSPVADILHDCLQYPPARRPTMAVVASRLDGLSL
ncbi:TKL protein kinase [Saprolegnia diclina VS20]|uniref:TKL protein kinase n=1 Tax=Saprolegnia diclina (strain VS20) TaxID=1156394 RepID=T0RTS7_SAPDV|nr:TKL protein kinase [Saprolegnia diclina VS20]EQC33747.1 TKL protein kinase [Saprolegnia diclina VS20]|eukprot:XP_008612970.1 TKL protein kinase [Saprolegnia diclina VS20]